MNQITEELRRAYSDSCEAQFALIMLIEGTKGGHPTPAAWDATEEAFAIATERIKVARTRFAALRNFHVSNSSADASRRASPGVSERVSPGEPPLSGQTEPRSIVEA